MPRFNRELLRQSEKNMGQESILNKLEIEKAMELNQGKRAIPDGVDTVAAAIDVLLQDGKKLVEHAPIELFDDNPNNHWHRISGEKWEEFVKSIEKDILIEKLGKKKANEFNPFRGFVDDQFQWSHGFRGKILLSDISDKTAYFDEGLNMKPHHNRTPFDEDIKTLRTYLAKL